MQFEDSAHNPLSVANLSVDEGATTPVFVALVPGLAGRTLTASPDSGLTVTARRTGSGDTFANIATAPIDLTPYAGALTSFDFKITAGAVSARSPLQATVKLGYA